MKLRFPFCAAFLILPLTVAAADQGLLRCPVSSGKTQYGKIGDVVIYRAGSNAKHPGFLDVRFDGRWLEDIGGYCVLPLDPVIVPPRVFLLLNRQMPPGSHEDLILLAKAALRHFPAHPLSEDILAHLAELSANEDPDGKSTPQEAVALAREYLRKYPAGKHRDKLEWLLCRWSNWWYEYEGVATGPASEAKAYEAFLKAHPNSTVVEEVKMRLAQVSRIASECIFHGSREGFTDADGRKFEARARELYQSLVASANPITRESARLTLANMKRGRSAYTCCNNDW